MVKLSEPGEVALQLDALLADRAQLAAMGLAARRAAQDVFCWEKEAPRLVAIVEAALAAPSPTL
jgi:hypothetical protein